MAENHKITDEELFYQAKEMVNNLIATQNWDKSITKLNYKQTFMEFYNILKETRKESIGY